MKPFARRRARECAVQALYSWQISSDDTNDIASKFLSEIDTSSIDVNYFYIIYNGVIKNYKKLDELMKPYIISRKLEELGNIEISILRISLFELTIIKNIPYKVSINEAIEISKVFCSEECYKFINGVLNKVFSIININKKIY